MKKWLVAIFVISLLLTGCTKKEETFEDPGIPQMVDVKIIVPEKLSAGTGVELAAHVSQGGENVDDAESVQFEIWESGLRDKGILLDGELEKDGIYKVNYTFDHDGVYYMFAHTTARGLHVMPKQQLTVGTPDMSKVLPDDASSDMSEMVGQ